ncbi:MAG TPA: hypothetical protein VE684_17935 [Crenalkalicoccus sp.]|jgi:uncharacterized protein YjiS (DUF1127 family)|nr:hypothetical protein [Crenalkalicoccus sp.]
MTVQTATSSFIPALADRRTAAVPAPRRVGLIACFRAWLARGRQARMLRDLDPRLARDIGIVPECDRAPEGFACDPRPLWGIGLSPYPMDMTPRWFRGQGRG